MRSFHPDLIIEVTSVCDRHCVGCYAPNLVSKIDPEQLFLDRPELFIDPKVLEKQLPTLAPLGLVAIRGGEPTRHPRLHEILQLCSQGATEVYLETHGRWIGGPLGELEGLCSQLGIVVKISFDRMHGTSVSELQRMTSILNLKGIPWVVAITEPNDDSFAQVRAMCDWVSEDQVIFQKKAVSLSDLITPSRGVIKTDGKFSSKLSVLSRFEALRVNTGVTA